jgi:hypothetical protein
MLVGSLYLQSKAIDAPVLSAAAVTAGELPPSQSTLFHFKTLSAELLVVCMADNVLRLVGWAGRTSVEMSHLLQLRESFTLQLENKVRTFAHLFGCKLHAVLSTRDQKKGDDLPRTSLARYVFSDVQLSHPKLMVIITVLCLNNRTDCSGSGHVRGQGVTRAGLAGVVRH